MLKPKAAALGELLAAVRSCQTWEDLPYGPHPVLQTDARARLLIVGQAPGRIVHDTGIPWNDRSGERLRACLGVDRGRFYGPLVALVPMGFCYPGSGARGSLPPRPALVHALTPSDAGNPPDVTGRALCPTLPLRRRPARNAHRKGAPVGGLWRVLAFTAPLGTE